MNISAVNCTPIKPQAFGNDIDKAQVVLTKSKALGDSFTKDPEQKSKIATAVSVAGAFLTCFLLGKGLASKTLEVFPKLTGHIVNLSKKVASGASVLAGKVKSVPVPEKVVNSKVATVVKETSEKIASNPKFKEAVDFASQKAGVVINKVKAQSPETLIKNSAGLASMALLGRQVSTVDGNGDGIADIAQKDVNAYKNAIGSLGLFSDIIDAIS